MGTERKLLTCIECGETFAVPVRKGRYPTRCSKQECRAASRKNPRWERLSEEEKQRRLTRRKRLNAQRRVIREAQRRHDQEAQEADRASKAEAAQIRQLGRERLDPLWNDDGAMILSKEVVSVGLLASQSRPAQKLDLARAVKNLAKAEGQDETYDLALELAGTAIAWAFKLRPDDYDYGELMAA